MAHGQAGAVVQAKPVPAHNLCQDAAKQSGKEKNERAPRFRYAVGQFSGRRLGDLWNKAG